MIETLSKYLMGNIEMKHSGYMSAPPYPPPNMRNLRITIPFGIPLGG
jgi:hypothetical protein